ncbi:membrane protein [Gordonia phage Madi]|uniref:Membrane protein n=1 Tax=Gordonia phage Sienna TaxID=2759396 RepID=A0A7L7SIQ7_9CAUD|nr:membrane protein [Gordonia phage Sienna]QYW00834.1 membrane protein [Gordonia phage Madi]
MDHDAKKDFEEKRKFSEAYDFIRGITVLLSAVCVLFGVLTYVFGDHLFGAGSASQYTRILSVPWSPESWGTFAIVCGVLILAGSFRSKQLQVGSGCTLMGLWSFALAYLIVADCVKYQTSYGALGALFFIFFGIAMLGRARLAFNWR